MWVGYDFERRARIQWRTAQWESAEVLAISPSALVSGWTDAGGVMVVEALWKTGPHA